MTEHCLLCNVQTLEYYQDLEAWYADGYGAELNGKVACPLVKDMVKIFS